ncbi:MAG: hypothetical protein AAB592_05620 [Patescibacteria group bacterium]|mgnify:CR=1 FL=1
MFLLRLSNCLRTDELQRFVFEGVEDQERQQSREIGKDENESSGDSKKENVEKKGAAVVKNAGKKIEEIEKDQEVVDGRITAFQKLISHFVHYFSPDIRSTEFQLPSADDMAKQNPLVTTDNGKNIYNRLAMYSAQILGEGMKSFHEVGFLAPNPGVEASKHRWENRATRQTKWREQPYFLRESSFDNVIRQVRKIVQEYGNEDAWGKSHAALEKADPVLKEALARIDDYDSAHPVASTKKEPEKHSSSPTDTPAGKSDDGEKGKKTPEGKKDEESGKKAGEEPKAKKETAVEDPWKKKEVLAKNKHKFAAGDVLKVCVKTRLNVRDENGRVTGKLDNGAQVKVVGDKEFLVGTEHYVHGEFADGKKGFIASKFTEKLTDGEKAGTHSPKKSTPEKTSIDPDVTAAGEALRSGKVVSLEESINVRPANGPSEVKDFRWARGAKVVVSGIEGSGANRMVKVKLLIEESYAPENVKRKGGEYLTREYLVSPKEIALALPKVQIAGLDDMLGKIRTDHEKRIKENLARSAEEDGVNMALGDLKLKDKMLEVKTAIKTEELKSEKKEETLAAIDLKPGDKVKIIEETREYVVGKRQDDSAEFLLKKVNLAAFKEASA